MKINPSANLCKINQFAHVYILNNNKKKKKRIINITKHFTEQAVEINHNQMIFNTSRRYSSIGVLEYQLIFCTLGYYYFTINPRFPSRLSNINGHIQKKWCKSCPIKMSSCNSSFFTRLLNCVSVLVVIEFDIAFCGKHRIWFFKYISYYVVYIF